MGNEPNEKVDVESPPNATLVEPLLPPPVELDAEPAVVLASDPSEINVQEVSFSPEYVTIDESGWEHGEVQAPSCRNWVWTILFLAQVALVTTLATMAVAAMAKGDYRVPWHEDDDSSTSFHISTGLLFFVATSSAIMVLSGALIMLLLGPLADMMIQLSLVLSPISAGLSALGALLVGQLGVALFMVLFCALGTFYAVRVWHRIPFATANMAVALAAIKENMGLLGMAYAMTFVAMLWTSIWALAVSQVTLVKYQWVMSCSSANAEDPDSANTDCHLTTQGKWILIGLVFCLYWTSQVIKNIFHTTIAGVVGTFWFAPSDATGGCCNPAIYDSWVRSTVYSLGSICLGSLLVAVMQVLQLLVRIARSQEEERRDGRRNANSLLLCLLQFVVDQLERLLEYVNVWAFVYVGLYGYEYRTAAHKVYQLFVARGWTMVLDDHLVSRALGMMQLFIGILSGIATVVIGLFFLPMGLSINPLLGFVAGVILGMLLTGIQLQVVTSAVETVVVCFAEAPSALIENHHGELSSRMIRAWRATYPNECGF